MINRGESMPEIINHKLKSIVFVGAVLLLVGSLLWAVQGKIRQLSQEKQYWQVQMDQIPSKNKEVNLPSLLDLPPLIEACQNEFKEQAVQVASANLDRFGEETKTSTDQGSGLSYALFHFKLKGSWSGIEAALKRIENIPDRTIQVQEVRLNSDSGDVVLKIYFYEPDKPSQP